MAALSIPVAINPIMMSMMGLNRAWTAAAASS
jgi:hypothetical protein